MATHVTLDPERIEEMRDRTAFYRPAAEAAQAAANACYLAGMAFGRRVFLSDISAKLGAPIYRLAPYWHALGWVELSRIDLPVDLKRTAASEIDINHGEATYHLMYVTNAR